MRWSHNWGDEDSIKQLEEGELGVDVSRSEISWKNQYPVITLDCVDRNIRVYKVYYVKLSAERHGVFGYNDQLRESDIPDTHELIAVVMARTLDQVFQIMQGEVWSPKGEARDYIAKSESKHTSMMVGDVICDTAIDRYYQCDFAGWQVVPK
jgi:hypothetical protein